jgi:hypothetical protein
MDVTVTEVALGNDEIVAAWRERTTLEDEAAALQARISADARRLALCRAALRTTHVHRGVAMEVLDDGDWERVLTVAESSIGGDRYALVFADEQGWCARLRLRRSAQAKDGPARKEPGARPAADRDAALAIAMDWVIAGDLPPSA